MFCHDCAEICAGSLRKAESVSCDYLAAADKVLISLSATRLSTMGSRTLCHALDATSLLISSAALCKGPAAEVGHFNFRKQFTDATPVHLLQPWKVPAEQGRGSHATQGDAEVSDIVSPMLTGGAMRLHAKQAGLPGVAEGVPAEPGPSIVCSM